MRGVLGALVVVGALLLPAAAPIAAAPPAPAFDLIGTFPVPAGGAEIGAATRDGRYLAVTAAESKKVSLLDLRNLGTPTQACSFDAATIGEPTSVDIPNSGRYALIAIKNDPNPGTVVAMSIPGCSGVVARCRRHRAGLHQHHAERRTGRRGYRRRRDRRG